VNKLVLQKIAKYGARWDINNHQGIVSLLYSSGDWKHITIKDPMEFYVIVDLLRNEKPILYDDQKVHILTSAEKVGEEE